MLLCWTDRFYWNNRALLIFKHEVCTLHFSKQVTKYRTQDVFPLLKVKRFANRMVELVLVRFLKIGCNVAR